MPPSISRRVFIQWLPDPPSEPTSTLVLTTSSGCFVDIRILNHALLDHRPPIQLASDQLDWAFAGGSRSKQLDGNQDSKPADLDPATYVRYKQVKNADQTSEEIRQSHTTWQHEIDSTTEDAAGIIDEGNMQYFPSLGLTLEAGQMPHPTTSRPSSYVEGWLDEDIRGTPGIADCLLWELTDPDLRAKGMFVKLGPYMQGVARVGECFSLVRIGWTAEMGWSIDASMGDVAFPSHADTHLNMCVGEACDVLDPNGRVWRWTVTELEQII